MYYETSELIAALRKTAKEFDQRARTQKFVPPPTAWDMLPAAYKHLTGKDHVRPGSDPPPADAEFTADLPLQQRLLDAWQDLYQQGFWVPGWNLAFPNHPYFHVRP